MNCRNGEENIEVQKSVKEVHRWSESGKNGKLKTVCQVFKRGETDLKWQVRRTEVKNQEL